MLSIFVRHTERCLKGDGTAKNPGLLAKAIKGKPFSPAELRAYKHCSCPKYYTGSYNGKWHPRTSADANTWEAAEREVQRVKNRLDGKPEDGAASKPAETGVAIDRAVKEWLIECELAGVTSGTQRFFDHFGRILIEYSQSI